jgi:hypothetical protein
MKEGIKLDEEIKVYFMQFRVEDRVHGQVAIVCFFVSVFSPCERSVTVPYQLSPGSVCVSNVLHNSDTDPDPRIRIHLYEVRIRIRILLSSSMFQTVISKKI